LADAVEHLMYAGLNEARQTLSRHSRTLNPELKSQLERCISISDIAIMEPIEHDAAESFEVNVPRIFMPAYNSSFCGGAVDFLVINDPQTFIDELLELQKATDSNGLTEGKITTNEGEVEWHITQAGEPHETAMPAQVIYSSGTFKIMSWIDNVNDSDDIGFCSYEYTIEKLKSLCNIEGDLFFADTEAEQKELEANVELAGW
jgi:hypothetical protein